MIAFVLMVFMGCSGGGGGGSSSGGGISSGLSGNFAPDTSPSCPSAPDTLSMRKQSVNGRIVTIGIQATDCDGSMGVYGVNFEVSFDPSVAQCATSNPCSAGTLLSDPLATPTPVCTCDNSSGQLLGSFSRKSPGTNQSVTGSADIARFALEIIRAGSGRVDFLNTEDINGTALITLNGSPVAITGLSYPGGAALGQ